MTERFVPLLVPFTVPECTLCPTLFTMQSSIWKSYLVLRYIVVYKNSRSPEHVCSQLSLSRIHRNMNNGFSKYIAMHHIQPEKSSPEGTEIYYRNHELRTFIMAQYRLPIASALTCLGSFLCSIAERHRHHLGARDLSNDVACASQNAGCTLVHYATPPARRGTRDF